MSEERKGEAPKITENPQKEFTSTIGSDKDTVRVSVERLERPKGLIEQVPEKAGFTRRVVRADEMDHMENEGWVRARKGKDERFKDRFGDKVADEMLVVEIPNEEYERYKYRHMGGHRNQLIDEDLRRAGRPINFRDGKTEGEELNRSDVQIPIQARIRR